MLSIWLQIIGNTILGNTQNTLSRPPPLPLAIKKDILRVTLWENQNGIRNISTIFCLLTQLCVSASQLCEAGNTNECEGKLFLSFKFSIFIVRQIDS